MMVVKMTSSNHWVLFGYDLHALVQTYRRAWRETFLSYNSGLRQRIDEPILVKRIGEEGGCIIGPDEEVIKSHAILLPDSHVLIRKITLPDVAESTLDEVVNSEILASSPFPLEDVASGWKIIKRSKGIIHIVLAIVSKSAVVSFFQRAAPEIDLDATEIWVEEDNEYIVIEGYGEKLRNHRYKSRLKKISVLIFLAAAFLMGIAAIPGIYKSYELEAMESWHDEISKEANEVLKLRASLTKSNELISRLNGEVQSIANPVATLSVITALLGDDVWVNHYMQKGRIVELDGNAANAAALMQKLSNSDVFEKVTARSGFRQVGRSEMERFQLELIIAKESVEP